LTHCFLFLLAYFAEVGSCYLHPGFVSVCQCLCIPPSNNFKIPKQIFMKLGMYITAPQPISAAYFINLSL
jgi:hypothetical protein